MTHPSDAGARGKGDDAKMAVPLLEQIGRDIAHRTGVIYGYAAVLRQLKIKRHDREVAGERLLDDFGIVVGGIENVTINQRGGGWRFTRGPFFAAE